MKVRRGLIRLLQVVLLAAVAVGLYDVLSDQLRQLSWDALRRAGRPNPVLLALSTLLLLCVYLMHALLWRRITRDLGGGSAPLRPTLHAYFVSGLGRYVPGRLWQLAGLAVLAGQAGLAPSRAMAASVLGQIGFLTTGLAFLAVTVPHLASAAFPSSAP